MANKSISLQENIIFKTGNSLTVNETDINMATSNLLENNDNVPIYFSKGNDNIQVKNNNNTMFDNVSDDTERTYSSLCTVDVQNDDIDPLNSVNNNLLSGKVHPELSDEISSNIIKNKGPQPVNTTSNRNENTSLCNSLPKPDMQRTQSNPQLNNSDPKKIRNINVQLANLTTGGLNMRRNSETPSNIYSNREFSHVITRNQTMPVQIPIIGYEVMEERARFTIYKLRIDDPRTGLSWMVFRRYTDFVRLYSKLKLEHRNLCLPLPEKRRFRNNFDPGFLDDRVRGLQIFVNAVVKKLSLDCNVREFFCLDEPPPVADSEPEAQALFGALEDTVGALKNQLRQQEEAMKYMRQKVFYLEEKMRECQLCNPTGNLSHDSPASGPSNGS